MHEVMNISVFQAVRVLACYYTRLRATPEGYRLPIVSYRRQSYSHGAQDPEQVRERLFLLVCFLTTTNPSAALFSYTRCKRARLILQRLAHILTRWREFRVLGSRECCCWPCGPPFLNQTRPRWYIISHGSLGNLFCRLPRDISRAMRPTREIPGAQAKDLAAKVKLTRAEQVSYTLYNRGLFAVNSGTTRRTKRHTSIRGYLRGKAIQNRKRDTVGIEGKGMNLRGIRPLAPSDYASKTSLQTNKHREPALQARPRHCSGALLHVNPLAKV